MDPEVGKNVSMTLTNNKSALSSPLLAAAVSSPTPAPSSSSSATNVSTNVSTNATKMLANDPYVDIVEDDCTDLEYYSKS